MAPKSMDLLLNTILGGALIRSRDVVCLSQAACIQSKYRSPAVPNKSFLLKELATFVWFAGLSSVDNILLIDDSPTKNLLNNEHNVVFPRTFCGEANDTYLNEHLLPWLLGLFKSNEAVPNYVKENPAFGGQCPVTLLSREGNLILMGAM